MQAGSNYAYMGRDESEEMELDEEEVVLEAQDDQMVDDSVNNIAPAVKPGFFGSLFGKRATAGPTGSNAPPRPPQQPQRREKRVVKKSNTNVLNILLGTVASETTVATGDPAYCPSCSVAFSNINTMKVVQTSDGKTKPNVPTTGGLVGDKWTCEFCGEATTLALAPEEIPSTNIVDYIIEPAPITNNNSSNLVSGDEAYVLFCVDISGSMQCTYEVPHDLKLRGTKVDQNAAAPARTPNKITYVSRLQCVQYGIEAQLEALEKEYPNRKVGIVAFNGGVTIIGDGASAEQSVTGPKLDNVAELLEIGSSQQLTSPVVKSRQSLLSKVFSLDAHGGTALGPAIAVAVGMTARIPGSKIVVCTDGLSNVGVGSVETLGSNAQAFFDQIGDAAKRNGTAISVLSIKGADCKLELLGRLAELTGGDVNIVDPLKLKEDFKSVLSLPVLATNVSIKVRLHRAFYISDALVAVGNESSLHKDVGNVNEDTTISLEYGAKESYKHEENVKALPFQLQIFYTTLKGMKCVRIITMTIETTTNQDLADEFADIDALGVNLVQTSAKIATTGDYQSSRAKNIQSAGLIGRVLKKQQAPTFSSSASPQQQQQQQQQQESAKIWLGQAQCLETQLTKTMKKEYSSPVPQQPQQQQQLNDQRISERSDETANMLYNMKSMNARKAKK
eukprot:gene3750-4324_t